MASHHLNSLYAIKECSTCGSLYTRECCSIRSFEDKILVPKPDSSPCCAKCGNGCWSVVVVSAVSLRKKLEKICLHIVVENKTSKTLKDIFTNDNTNVVNAPSEPFVVNQDPVCKLVVRKVLITIIIVLPKVSDISKDPERQCNQTINELPQILPSVHPTCNYEDENSFIYDSKPHSFNDSVDCQEALDKILEELEEIKRDQRMLKELKKRIAEEQTAKENMSIEEMRHEQQLVDYKIKEITNDLGYKRFRGEKIDEEYERDCEIRIRKLKQDFNEWGSKVRKKEQAYNEEQYSAARRRMLSIPFVDEDDYIPLGDIIARYSTSKAITPALSPEEPVDSLIMEDEHLDTIPETESDEFIKSSVENLVQNPSESADLSDGESECDVPINDDSPESHFTTFSNPLFDSNDDFSSDDESLSEEEIQKDEFKYFSNPLYDLDDEIITNEKILPNQKDLDVVIPIPPGIDKRCFNAESDLLESLLNRDSPIDSTKIDSIFDEFSLPRPPEESNSEYSDATIESLSPSPIPVEDSDPFMEEIDIFLASDDSTPPGVESDYDSEGDILSLEKLLKDDSVLLAEYNQFTFDIKPDTVEKNDLDELNKDECFNLGGGENVVFLNVEEDDSFTFSICTFLPFVTYPEVSPLLSSTKNEDTIFDPGIVTFHKPVDSPNNFFEASRVRGCFPFYSSFSSFV
ncbi:hypothetical protein Tco_0760839 [Tanacetum coccineum]